MDASMIRFRSAANSADVQRGDDHATRHRIKADGLSIPIWKNGPTNWIPHSDPMRFEHFRQSRNDRNWRLALLRLGIGFNAVPDRARNHDLLIAVTVPPHSTQFPASGARKCRRSD